MSGLLNSVNNQTGNNLLDRSNQNALPIGQHRGESVRVDNSAKSLLASAAEEMSFMRAEKKTHDLSKRKVADKSLYNADSAEHVKKYLDKVKDIDKQKDLYPFFQNLQKQHTLNPKEFAAKYFSDVSQQYIALLFAKDELKRSKRTKKTNELLTNIEDSLTELIDQNGKAIHAGINISDVAQENSGTTLGTLNHLRQLYRDSVLDYGGLSSTFQALLDKYEGQHIAESIQYLITALGADIASEGPSIPKERLQMIVEDIFKLQAIESIHDECDELLIQLSRIFQLIDLPKDYELIQKLLSLLEYKWITTEHILKLVASLNMSQADIAIFFLKGLKDLARTIPIKAYEDIYERDKLISVIQEALDQRIEEEELLSEED